MTSAQLSVGQGTVIITGGNSGVGYQAACALATKGGWHIVIACRHLAAAAAAEATVYLARLKQIGGLVLKLEVL